MLIFLDLETTGLEPSDKIISIGLVVKDDDGIKEYYDEVNEGKKISPKASSINHITNEDIKNKPTLKDSETFKILDSFNKAGVTLVCHNIAYDLKMLRGVGFEWLGEMIDTLRTSKHLMNDCEEFSLQFLRYELRLYKSEPKGIVAHNALSDAQIIKLLYEYLLDLAQHQELEKLSFEKVLMQKFEFGKYAGRYIEEISMLDRRYLEWMLGNIVDLDEDLRYSIEYNL